MEHGAFPYGHKGHLAGDLYTEHEQYTTVNPKCLCRKNRSVQHLW